MIIGSQSKFSMIHDGRKTNSTLIREVKKYLGNSNITEFQMFNKNKCIYKLYNFKGFQVSKQITEEEINLVQMNMSD